MNSHSSQATSNSRCNETYATSDEPIVYPHSQIHSDNSVALENLEPNAFEICDLPSSSHISENIATRRITKPPKHFEDVLYLHFFS